ncbi:MAG: chloride channel protein [Actinobacteria bacterium]|nr:chloride channel protein [Actinomycetota bacterium]
MGALEWRARLRRDHGRPRLRLDRRQQVLLAAAAGTGVLVGLVVAAFDRLVAGELVPRLFDLPIAVAAALPLLGLGGTWLALTYAGGGATPSTSDEYVVAYHERRALSVRPLAGRLLAGVATLGLGGAMGLEGPSVYAGATIGGQVQRRLRRLLAPEDARALLVAGAAAGVSAVFKAPATGVVFALEVPYRGDVVRRALLPALVASATAYLAFAALVGTARLFPLAPVEGRFRYGELLAALVTGLLAGLGARTFAVVIHRAKHLSASLPPAARILGAGAGLAGLALASRAAFGTPLTLGPGYATSTWASVATRSLALVALLFVLRYLATALTVAGGGVGGLFVPLVVQGLLLGRVVAGAYDGLGLSSASRPEAASSLFPVIGIAAFLGAGYRTPLAGVMFVAETTGSARFVVPALLASAAAQFMMGDESVSSVQQSARLGHLERRFELPVAAAVDPDVSTADPGLALDELYMAHVVGSRQRVVPVVAAGRFLGVVHLEDLLDVPRAEWAERTASDLTEAPSTTATPDGTLVDAIAAMQDIGSDRLDVVDRDGCYVGELRLSEILALDEILREQEAGGEERLGGRAQRPLDAGEDGVA